MEIKEISTEIPIRSNGLAVDFIAC